MRAMNEHDERPWGSYTVIDDAPTHKVKRIEVSPGKRLSYQRHAHRLGAGDAIDIAVGAAHRVANPTGEALVFVEIQTGTYFGEDDIERLEDDFGRS